MEESGNVAQHEPEDDVDKITFFAPIRPTAARSLRPGDEILVPTGKDPFPQVAYRARITDIREDEASRMITVNGEFVGETSGLFEKPAHPGEMLQRLLQPGGPVPGTESVLVRAEQLWKWIGVDMNDPDGSTEKFVLRTFQRVNSDETGTAAIEVRLQSKSDPRKVRILTFKPDATVGFKGHR
jgi:hypothetical protein